MFVQICEMSYYANCHYNHIYLGFVMFIWFWVCCSIQHQNIGLWISKLRFVVPGTECTKNYIHASMYKKCGWPLVPGFISNQEMSLHLPSPLTALTSGKVFWLCFSEKGFRRKDLWRGWKRVESPHMYLYRIMYWLGWRTIYAFTRGLFWSLFPKLRSNEGNIHQNNTWVGV